VPLPIQKSVAKTVPLPIQKSIAKLCHCQFKNQQKKYVVANSEIASQKLYCCRFQNRQPSSMPLPIQKSVANNYAAADAEIGSQVLCHCQSRNRQPQTLPLPIMKSGTKLCCCQFRNRQPKALLQPILKWAAKYCATADLEIGNKNCDVADPKISSLKLCRCCLEIGSQKLCCY
jgi:hypothetical protein